MEEKFFILVCGYLGCQLFVCSAISRGPELEIITWKIHMFGEAAGCLLQQLLWMVEPFAEHFLSFSLCYWSVFCLLDWINFSLYSAWVAWFRISQKIIFKTLNFFFSCFVTYWPSTELSIKRYTCVNKQKNSGSRWASNKNITRTQIAWVSCSWSQLETRCQIESQRQTESFGPSVTHGWAAQPEWERSAAMVRRTWGQYVAVCPRLQLISHTQPTSTLSRIKCERYIFIKKCVRSLKFVIIVDYVSVCICIMAIQQFVSEGMYVTGCISVQLCYMSCGCWR